MKTYRYKNFIIVYGYEIIPIKNIIIINMNYIYQ